MKKTLVIILSIILGCSTLCRSGDRNYKYTMEVTHQKDVVTASIFDEHGNTIISELMYCADKAQEQRFIEAVKAFVEDGVVTVIDDNPIGA